MTQEEILKQKLEVAEAELYYTRNESANNMNEIKKLENEKLDLIEKMSICEKELNMCKKEKEELNQILKNIKNRKFYKICTKILGE